LKIQRFRLKNFRPFYQESPWFNLSLDKEKNITVFHCENGVGKTSLLNAFTWAFYRTLTSDVQNTEEIVNKRAIREANVNDEIECWVEILFEHLNRKYRLRRTLIVKKIDDQNNWVNEKESVILQFVNDSGTWEEIKNYQDEIGRILPEKLHNYFFFNGERIEWIQRPINRKEFTDAVTLLIGEETYNRAIRHLNGAKKKLEEEQENIGDATTKHLYEEKKKIEEEIEDLEKAIGDLDRNIEGLQNEKKILSEKLRTLGGEAAKLEERRVNLEEQLKKVAADLTENRQAIISFLSNKGYLIYSQGAIIKVLDSINNLINSGQIPRPYKASFVEQLLNKGECICERPLVKGEAPYQAVKNWLDKANMTEYEDNAIQIKHQFRDVSNEISLMYDELDRLQEVRNRCLSERQTIEEELSQIGEKLKGSDIELARRLEAELEENQQKIDDYLLKKGELTKELKDKQNTLKEKEREIQRREANSEKEKQIKYEILLASMAIHEIEQRREKMRSEHRRDLEQRIDRLFNSISYKPYHVRLADDYSLSLIGPDGVVGKSTSESQILSLSFIGALIEQIREYIAEKELVGLSSSQYPLVMDSPFGNLGEAYQLNIGELLFQLADQIVVLVSKSQWEGNISKTIGPKVGKHYIISYYTPKETKREVFVEINGRSFPLVKRYAGEEEIIEYLEA
jgi:DNA sulfur modification protein DndD